MARKLKHPVGLRWVGGEMLPLSPEQALYAHRMGEVYIDPETGYQMQLHREGGNGMRAHFEMRRTQKPDLFIRGKSLWPVGHSDGD